MITISPMEDPMGSPMGPQFKTQPSHKFQVLDC